MRKLISIVTPCFNEEHNIEECYSVVKSIFNTRLVEYDYEHIFCDNGSSDQTLNLLIKLAHSDHRLKIIANARNFGVFNSMFNGLMSTSGDAVIPFLPADLQDPPELIPEFINRWESGFEIVYGVRNERDESRTLHLLRRLYYKLVNKMALIEIPLNVGEFSLIDKKIVNSLRNYDDYYPYLRGMIASCGFKSTFIKYTWKARKRGVSKANLYALIDQGLNGLISFTNIPMRIFMFFGFLVASFSIIYSIITALISLVYFRQLSPPGIQTLIVALFFFSGVILFGLGIIGEYISAIHFQVRKKPLVIEIARINFD